MAISNKVTIQQIADRANVSTATASRVLNNPGSVKEETRNRVLQAMKELGCRLKRGSDKLLLVSFTDFVNPFYSECISGMQEAAKRRGYQLFLQQTEDYATSSAYDFLLNTRFFHGIIFCHCIPDSEILANIRMKYPIVFCSQHNIGTDVPFVAVDDHLSALSAVNYLISTGRTKIAMLNSSLSFTYASLREKGFRDAMAAANLPVREKWIAHLPEIDADLAASVAASLLSADETPDAIFCVSDVYACAAVKAAHALNKAIPSDIAIMGFDNISLTTMMAPPVSTVSQPTFQLGYQSCTLLMDMIEGTPVLNPHIYLSTEIVVRGTT